MKRVLFVPIELLKERYSYQWYHWFRESFYRLGVKVKMVGDETERSIAQGQFLDIYETNQYKFRQMQELVRLLATGKYDDYTVFFMDLWFPGLEAIAYLRDCAKKPIKIKGILHAGTYDPYDFLTQSGCEKWGKDLETAWLKIADEVFVATNFHKDMLIKARGEHTKITVVKFPIYRNDALAHNVTKANLVVFPHRLSPEKQPEQFEEIKAKFKEKYPNVDANFVRTKDLCPDKESYYKLLALSKVSVSTALQETFGIAMLESLAMGCVPVAPDRLSYPETLKDFLRYNTIDEAVDLIHNALRDYGAGVYLDEADYPDNVDNIVEAI